jgi:hypothetical protein
MAQLDDSLLGLVMRLPFDQRLELADRLLESIHPPEEDVGAADLHEIWLSELRARVAESGFAGVPAELVWDKLDARKQSAASG